MYNSSILFIVLGNNAALRNDLHGLYFTLLTYFLKNHQHFNENNYNECFSLKESVSYLTVFIITVLL